MPVIRINDATFADLKSVATWLGTETPSQTVDCLVREKMDLLGLERDDVQDEVAHRDSPNAPSAEGALEFRSAPGLSFTRMLEASVDGQPQAKANWSAVLLEVITSTKKKTGMDATALSHELQVPSKPYEYASEGYKFLPDLGISIQGQSLERNQTPCRQASSGCHGTVPMARERKSSASGPDRHPPRRRVRCQPPTKGLSHDK